MKNWAVVLVALASLAGCGDSDSGDSDSGDDRGAQDVAADIEAKIDTVSKTVEITEDNDPNELIGRPGAYTEAVSIYDSRVTCDSDLDVTCGAKVEVFEDADAAKTRFDYIQGIVEEGGGLLTEYDYLDGTVLLRVSGSLKPSEAEEYESALTS